MSFLVPARRPSKELLDDPDFPAEDLPLYFDDLELVDRLWGNSRLLAGHLEKNLKSQDGVPLTVLDVGAGSGHVSSEIAARLRRRGRSARVVALDIHWSHLAAGRAHDGAGTARAAADAFELPFRDDSADWIVSALFFHHFSPEENVRLLRELSRVARLGFALVDIRRHRFLLSFFRIAGRLRLGCPASLEDGIASVRQAYTVEEAREIAERAVPGARVRRVFPYRLLVFKPPRH